MASDAVRLTETLRIEAGKIGAQAADKTPDDLRKAADAAAVAGKFDAAQKLAAAAVAAAPKDPANWLAYADVAIKADDAKANGRWELVTQGATAAYAAYQHSATPAAQAQALAALGDLLARHEAWRGALDAYKASLDRRDNIDVRKIYEAMREEHGFRILDYKVDNELSAPRVCFNFSEQLARKTDFAPYVAVSGASNTAISTEDQQICVEGLKHGERYAIVLRQGLPSAVGESLLKSADYEIYVRDRSPQAHFAGKAYVLPRQGQEGAPLVTVNTAKVAIDVYRIGDRNLLATVSRDDFLKPIDTSRAQDIENTDGVKVWSGSMDVASELNKDVVTEFPVLKAVGPLKPGVYLVTARPWKEKASDSEQPEDMQLATQWMVVSDLGLTAMSGDDGVHALVQSLGSAGPLAGVELKLVARNNEVLATKTTGPDGRVDFDPGLSRGKGGSAPGLLVATLGDDYNFLNLAQNAFDLTDRGVGGRDAPAGLDAFLYTERGVYRSGETVFATALLRDAKGVAKPGLPLTLVVKRPDGVEYKRATLPDEGMGGRAFAVPLLPGSAPGSGRFKPTPTRRATRSAKSSSCSRTIFPSGSISLCIPPSLSSIPASRSSSRSTRASSTARRRAGSTSPARSACRRSRTRRLAGFPGYVAGLADDEFTTVENQFTDKVQTDAKGHADLSVDLPEATATRPLEAKLIVDVAEPGGRTVERTVTLPVRAKGVMVGVKKDFDEFDRRRRPGDLRGDRRRPRRLAGRAQRGGMVALSGDQRLSVVQRRRPLELRAGQVVEAGGERDDRHRRRRAGQVLGAGRLGRAPARRQDARRRGDELRVRRRLVGDGERRRARQRRRDAGQDELRPGRRGEAPDQFGLRRQGDGRADRRRRRAPDRRRSRRRRQCRAVHGRRRLGPGRLCGRADPPAARRRRAAHAGPGDRRSPGSASRRTRASSTSRSTRRRSPSRASR